MENLLNSSFPVEPDLASISGTDIIPADVLEAIEASQTEAASTIDAVLFAATVEDAINDALGAAGILEPELRTKLAQELHADLTLLLHLGIERVLIQREAPGLDFYDGLREAIATREQLTRYWKVTNQRCTLIEEFQCWVIEQRDTLRLQIEELETEMTALMPLARTARSFGTNAELVTDYNERCARLFEVRESLALIEAHFEEATRFEDETELPSTSEGMRLLWERFVADVGAEHFS